MRPLRLRRAPEDRPAPRSSAGGAEHLPSVLVMTMVRDEAVMLPRWIDHYARHVGPDNLLVLDDHTTDGSTDDLPCTVHRLPSLTGKKYERTRMTLASGLARGYLAAYDWVVFVDADEFLVPDPAVHTDLRAFLATRADRQVVAPVALNVVHATGAEGPLRRDEPVLGQRRCASFAPIMCKPSVKRVPAPWRWASHGIEAEFAVDPELFMVHLKFADRDLLARVAAHRQALVEHEGRPRATNWSRGADDLVAVLDRVVADVDPDRIPELDVSEHDLAAVVDAREGWHRAVGAGQVQALERMPVHRIPERLLGQV